jgi:hypothetical protein
MRSLATSCLQHAGVMIGWCWDVTNRFEIQKGHAFPVSRLCLHCCLRSPEPSTHSPRRSGGYHWQRIFTDLWSRGVEIRLSRQFTRRMTNRNESDPDPSPSRRRGWSQQRSPSPWTGAPCSLQRTWAGKDGTQSLPPLLLSGQKDCSQKQESLHV